MKIEKINKKVIKIIVDQGDYDLAEYYDSLIFLEAKNILTYGDTNYRVFEKFFEQNEYTPEPLDLCLEDDKSIGLEMPKVWYLNKGKHALSIAMYYNYLNWHGVVENKNLKTFNQKIAKDYGRISCIEVYLEKDLKHFLDLKKIEYFGTPRTLTECVRYLEGWSIDKYPRLKGYATFSKFIELWSRINFPHFNSEEWFLGKEKSNRLNKTGQLTNVKKAVQFFWQNYLLKKHKKISDEDVEVDILNEKFNRIRQPNIILLSEDLFSDKNSNFEIFKNLTKKLSKEKIYISKLKNDFQEKNAKIAREIYPDSLIVSIENDESLNRNFSLMNPIKQSVNTDVVVATKILRYILENNLL
jgi:hypothetical protein